jgi:hypothetical protein
LVSRRYDTNLDFVLSSAAFVLFDLFTLFYYGFTGMDDLPRVSPWSPSGDRRRVQRLPRHSKELYSGVDLLGICRCYIAIKVLIMESDPPQKKAYDGNSH